MPFGSFHRVPIKYSPKRSAAIQSSLIFPAISPVSSRASQLPALRPSGRCRGSVPAIRGRQTAVCRSPRCIKDREIIFSRGAFGPSHRQLEGIGWVRQSLCVSAYAPGWPQRKQASSSFSCVCVIQRSCFLSCPFGLPCTCTRAHAHTHTHTHEQHING